MRPIRREVLLEVLRAVRLLGYVFDDRSVEVILAYGADLKADALPSRDALVSLIADEFDQTLARNVS